MNKKEKLFMAALGWLHDGLLFGCLFLIPAAVPGQGRTAGILTGSGLLLGLMSAVSWLCVRKLRSGVLYGAAAALLSGAAALLAFFLGSGYGIVWQTALPAAVLLFSLMLFGMRATDKIRKNRADRELREMPGVIPDGQKGGLAEILDEPAPPHLLLFGAVYLGGQSGCQYGQSGRNSRDGSFSCYQHPGHRTSRPGHIPAGTALLPNLPPAVKQRAFSYTHPSKTAADR